MIGYPHHIRAVHHHISLVVAYSQNEQLRLSSAGTDVEPAKTDELNLLSGYVRSWYPAVTHASGTLVQPISWRTFGCHKQCFC